MGILCLIGGLTILGWFAFSYFCLAFLTAQLIEDISVFLLFEGFLHALYSLPGLTGVVLTGSGVLLLKKTGGES